jgi:lambda family phage minor tail protein L
MIIDINKQRVDSELVELFELNISGTIVYFTTYPTSVKFSERNSPYIIREYIPLPIEFSGYEQKSEGAYSRPTIVFANVLSTFKSTIGTTNDDLIGKKITRRKTLLKHLATGSVGTNGSAPIEQPQQVFFIDRIEKETAQSVVFELTSGFDLQGVTVPNRYILANTCTWLYQGVELTGLGGCTWKVANNNPGFVVRYDSNDRPILSGSVSNMPTTGQTVTQNYVYRVAKTVTPVTGSTTTRYDYYQALISFTKTATLEVANFRKCRLIDGAWTSSPYVTYREGKIYNPLVTYNGKVWVATSPSTNVPPGTDEFVWERADLCGKKLSSCAIRFKAKEFTGQGLSAPSYSQVDDNAVLPYGGFPGAKRFNR